MSCYYPGSLNQVDPYFVQELVVLLLIFTHSVTVRTKERLIVIYELTANSI